VGATAVGNTDVGRLECAQAQRFTTQGEAHDVKLRQEAVKLRQLGLTRARQFARRDVHRSVHVE
jgi:hypothetical protein